MLGGIIWGMERATAGGGGSRPVRTRAGVLDIAGPYLENTGGTQSDRTPPRNRGGPHDDAVDNDCPWQFANVREA